MRRVVSATIVLFLLASVVAVESRSTATGRAGATRARSPRAASRLHLDADAPASASECDTPRGVRAFGSSERCLRVLCVDHNQTNAYDLDAAQRLRRNPCAGMDLFAPRR
jgi:hypothetical protein